MAKINRVSRLNDLWLVRIDVDDPECKWNINPTSTYYKLIKATSIPLHHRSFPVSALKKPANLCTDQKIRLSIIMVIETIRVRRHIGEKIVG